MWKGNLVSINLAVSAGQPLQSVEIIHALPSLVHQGGLRAEILNEGIIRVGDPITEADQ